MSERPKKVTRARIAGDTEALSRMGQAGAKRAHENRMQAKAIDEIYEERRMEDVHRVARERNDHLLPEDN